MKSFATTCLVVFLVQIGVGASAQNLLNKTVSLDVKAQHLANVLEILSNKGNFYFSYNSNSIEQDSLVTLTAINKSVRQILELLLPDNYEFRESGNYIIIRKVPIRMTLLTNKAVAEDRFYTVSGYVMDDESGSWIHNASIYEKRLLASTLSNTNGYFKLRFKEKNKNVVLTVSKEFYQDTTFAIDAGYNQQLSITLLPVTSGLVTIISPEDYFAPEQLKVRVQTDTTTTEYIYTRSDSVNVERRGIGRFLVSSKQRIQSVNLKQFFISRPFQISFTPGLGTHGHLSAQVTNNVSFNILGGYNGGVNGVELGGLFNINKESVQYVQLAGLFNLVGGHMKGVQAAGISNTVMDSAAGFQAGGISNVVTGRFSGFQLGGIYNHASGRMNGFQLAGIGNFTKKAVKGVQIAGIVNYAKRLRGLQIGLINIADSSEGFSFGLINIIIHGYHKLTFSTDEVVNLNAAFKTGNIKLYSILQAGLNVSDSAKAYTFGYGIGKEISLGKIFSLNPELTAQHLYLGSWDYANILSKARLNLNSRLGKYVSLFGGPVFNAYYSKQTTFTKGYRNVIPPASYHTYDLGSNVKGWLGWNVGINFF